jgi:hypothetical protein
VGIILKYFFFEKLVEVVKEIPLSLFLCEKAAALFETWQCVYERCILKKVSVCLHTQACICGWVISYSRYICIIDFGFSVAVSFVSREIVPSFSFLPKLSVLTFYQYQMLEINKFLASFLRLFCSGFQDLSSLLHVLIFFTLIRKSVLFSRSIMTEASWPIMSCWYLQFLRNLLEMIILHIIF